MCLGYRNCQPQQAVQFTPAVPLPTPLQVDALRGQVAQMEGGLKEKGRLEAAVAAAEKLRAESDDKLRRAVRENEAIQHEV